jgi:hypothetical protein
MWSIKKCHFSRVLAAFLRKSPYFQGNNEILDILTLFSGFK